MIQCKRLNIRIIPIHLLRDDPRIKIADDGSKTVDTDDWQIDDETFQRNKDKYNFTIDLFVSDRNSKCKQNFPISIALIHQVSTLFRILGTRK